MRQALVVGCNEAVLKRHGDLLPKEYSVYTAKSGEEAIEILKERKDICVVLAEDLNCKADKGMMSGKDLAYKVNEYHNIPTIMLPCACNSFGKDISEDLGLEKRDNTYFLSRTPSIAEMDSLLESICTENVYI